MREDMVARIVDEDASGITIRGAKAVRHVSHHGQRDLRRFRPAAAAGRGASGVLLRAADGHQGPQDAVAERAFEAHAPNEYDNPLAYRYDENDALVFFDDVKVPWERVFLLRNTDMCRAQLHDTPAHVYQNYQAQIRLSVKLRFLVGLAGGIAKTIGTINFPPVVDSARQARLAGRADRGRWCSAWKPAARCAATISAQQASALCSAGAVAGDVSRRSSATIRELAGGALLMLPSSVDDFSNPEIADIIGLTQISPAMSGQDRVKLLKLTWDAVGSEFASRHLQYEMFYAGAQFVTRGHSYRTYDWERAAGMAEKMTAKYDLPEFKGSN